MRFTAVCLVIFALTNSIRKVRTDDYGDYEDYGDSKACNMSERITGGTVKYSNRGAVGSEVTYDCPDGFEPYPVAKKVCSSTGVWEPKVARVKCEEEDDYEDYVETKKNCSVKETIKSGWVTYSKEGLEGSVLTYHCNPTHYSYPTRFRVCDSRGKWSDMVLPNGRSVSSATCKEVLCPAQLQLDNGEVLPKKQWFKVGEEQRFSCKEGFILMGSAQRNCTKWGHWTGKTPVCDDQSDDCRNPGTPPGGFRSGDRFRIGDKVKYRCQPGLDLLGPETKVCLDSKEWSGPTPRCQSPFVFDSPETVAEAMGGSLSAVMDVSSPDFKKKKSYGRSLKMAEGRLNIFILLDTSGSILEEHFKKAKHATAELIKKLDSYDVNIKFDIISYASEPQDIVSVLNEYRGVESVLQKLKDFDYSIHDKKVGTNLHKALMRVYERLSFLKAKKDSHFNETQNVILIETDGYSNMGPNPEKALSLIRDLMGYHDRSMDHTKEELLDVYVFGVGENVKRNELKSLASSKSGEEHLFLLSSYDNLGTVFNSMINDTAVTKCGVAQEIERDKYDNDAAQPATTRPWLVTLSWKPCKGSILTENWVITAAHCLIKLKAGGVETAKAKDVKIEHGDGTVDASVVIIHSQFDITGLRDKNVPEFYDYDVALIKVSQKIKLSANARPICLPCTKSSNRALRLGSADTCETHKKSLLSMMETPAFFTRQGKNQKQTHIHTGQQRAKCIEQYSPHLASNKLVHLTDVVTERFLCTGGTEGFQDYITCKGDSGGALFLRKQMRYFQVGVVSWGTKSMCDSESKKIQPPEEDARDFHISVFSIMPWLKEHLGKELEFLPM